MSVVIYHNDNDGRAAAAILCKFIPHTYAIRANYGTIPWDKLRLGEEVYLVDICFTKEEMLRFNQDYRLTHIDHHEKALQILQDCNINPPGIRDISKAACVLAWEFCCPNKPMPKTIEWIGKYDLWKLDDPAILEFFYGTSAYDLNPSKKTIQLWDKLLHDDPTTIANILQTGKEIKEYIDLSNRTLCKDLAFETKIGKHPALAINERCCNSLLFESVMDPTKHDLICTFSFIGSLNQYRFSLYTTDESKGLDVNKIASKFDGGGHKNAAGFTRTLHQPLPFELCPDTTPDTELYYGDVYKEVTALKNSSNVVKSYVLANNKINIFSRFFYTRFNNELAVACNTHNVDPDSFFHLELLGIRWLINFVWTNKGKWRRVIRPFFKTDPTDLKILARDCGGKLCIDDPNAIIIYSDTINLPSVPRER